MHTMNGGTREVSTYEEDTTMPENDDLFSSDGTGTPIALLEVPEYKFESFLVAELASHEPTEPESSDLTKAETEMELDRVELAQWCLEKAKQHLAKNDAMQASEKLYKAAEESIKFLAEHENLKEVQTAANKGKWETGLLMTASKKLTSTLNNEEIDGGWLKAWDVHVWGFHENKYGIEETKPAVLYIEKLLEHARGVRDAE